MSRHSQAVATLAVLLVAVAPLAAEERPSLYQSRRLLPAGEDPHFFGISVALDGDTAAVGANNEDDGGEDAGAVYVFQRDGNDWLPAAHLLVAGSDNLGDSVALDGDTLLAGAAFTHPVARGRARGQVDGCRRPGQETWTFTFTTRNDVAGACQVRARARARAWAREPS